MHAHRWTAWTVFGALSVIWAAALGVTVYDAVARADRLSLHVSAVLDCGTGEQAQVTSAPTVSVTPDGERLSVSVTVSLDSTAQGCRVVYTPLGSGTTAALDGHEVSVPQHGQSAVTLPADGRSHAVRLAWSGRRPVQHDAVGRTGLVINTFLIFPPGNSGFATSDRLLDSAGPVLRLTAPPGHRPVGFNGALRSGRILEVPLGTGGTNPPDLTVRFDRTATHWIAVVAPYVLAVTTTMLVLLAVDRRRGRPTSSAAE